MLTHLPRLFSVDFVATVAQLERQAFLAARQQVLVRRVFLVATGFCSLTLFPAMNGAGPLLSWAAGAWPLLFEPLRQLADEPMSGGEAVASVATFLGFCGICLNELIGLRRCREALELLEPQGSLTDACARLAARAPSVATYLARVQSRRPLRTGDWQLCRKLAKVS